MFARDLSKYKRYSNGDPNKEPIPALGIIIILFISFTLSNGNVQVTIFLCILFVYTIYVYIKFHIYVYNQANYDTIKKIRYTTETNITPPSSGNRQVGVLLCIICMVNERDQLTMPCKHFAMCKGCSQIIIRDRKECPVCNRRIQRNMTIYHP